MKKLLYILISFIIFIPQFASAALPTGWQTKNLNWGAIFPTPINGINQDVLLGGTSSSTATIGLIQTPQVYQTGVGAVSLINMGTGSLNLGNAVPLQANGFGTGYSRIQTSTSSNDLEQWQINNISTGTSAGTCFFMGNDITVYNTIGAASANYGGICQVGSHYNLPGFNGIKQAGLGIFSSNYPVTIGTGAVAGPLASIFFQAGSGLDASYDAVLTASTSDLLAHFGVGTSSPWRTLSIKGSSDLGNNALAGSFTATSTTATSTFAYGINLSGGCFALNGTCVSGGGGSGSGTVLTGLTGQNAFYASNGTTISPTSSLFIAPSSFVGFGTTSPQRKVDISASDSGITPLASFSQASESITNTNTTNGNFTDLAFLTADVNGATTGGAKISTIFTSHAAGAVSGDLVFYTKNAGAIAESTRITAGGNVGFGTTTPYAKLSVVGTVVASNFIATSTMATSTLQDTNVGTGTGTFNVDYNGYVGISTSTVTTGGAQATSALLNLGNNPATTNSSTTILMNKLQWDGLDSGGTRRCTFINNAGALTTITGKCNN